MGLKALERAKFEGWFIDHLRFTLFPAEDGPSPETLPAWWEIVNPGSEHQNRVEQKLPNGGQVVSLEGPWGGDPKPPTDALQPRLQMVMRLAPSPEGKRQAERIDLFLSPFPQENFTRPPVLEDISLVETFRQQIADLLSKTPPARRLALGSVFLREGDSSQEVLRFLQRKLKTVQLDPTRTKDFTYRVNRPSKLPSAEGQIEINRIHEWSLATFSVLITSDLPAFTQGQEYVTQFARLLLDINTDAAYTGPPFEGSEAKRILDRLFAEGLDILVKGDTLTEGEGDD